MRNFSNWRRREDKSEKLCCDNEEINKFFCTSREMENSLKSFSRRYKMEKLQRSM